MQEFWMYFNIGREHIADLNGYDHILFIAALCLTYSWNDWKKVLVLVTAFTIGHSITLALSTLQYIHVSTKWIEFLIPLTIMVTAITDIARQPPKRLSGYGSSAYQQGTRFPLIYYYALFFGLIHGMGFANGLRSLLGKNINIVTELLAFNLGLEAGQLLIVAAVLTISLIFVRLFRIIERSWQLFIAGGIFAMALQMSIERFPL